MSARRDAQPPIGVIGAGSWGTALAIQLARNGRTTLLWGRPEDGLERMAAERSNERYLPGAAFPEPLRVEPSLAALLAECGDLLVVTPSHGLRGVFASLQGGTQRIAWATKGFEEGSGKLPHEVARETLGATRPLAVLSGPTFATEVAKGLPTALTVAATDARFGEDLASALHSPTFRAYTGDDLVGVGVGGAVKNVIAIAAGISDGLGFGANARAALITRGLAEVRRLGIALGAKPETFMGLAGVGDLVLTCTDDQSRNRRFGLALAAGHGVDDAKRKIGQVVEGAWAARDALTRARAVSVEMPIAEQVYRVIYERVEPQAALRALQERARRKE
jgi:glycerol-3-phosphate dehydrogenase (NAD(P)+)